MFDAMGALSTSFNDNPTAASRAFDQARDGFVFGGGGGIVLIEVRWHGMLGLASRFDSHLASCHA